MKFALHTRTLLDSCVLTKSLKQDLKTVTKEKERSPSLHEMTEANTLLGEFLHLLSDYLILLVYFTKMSMYFLLLAVTVF